MPVPLHHARVPVLSGVYTRHPFNWSVLISYKPTQARVPEGRLRRAESDVIVVSIKEAIPRGRVKKGDVHRAVIVRTSKEVRRNDGTCIRFDRNAAVLVNKSNEPRHYASCGSFAQ